VARAKPNGKAKSGRRIRHKQLSHRAREGVLLLVLAVALFLLVCFASFSPLDTGWSVAGLRDQPMNLGGRVGAYFADLFLSLLGYPAFLLPFMIAWTGWMFLRERDDDDALNVHVIAFRWMGFLVTLVAAAGLIRLHSPYLGELYEGSGGMLGQFVEWQLVGPLSRAGAGLLLLATLMGGITLVTGLSWFRVMDAIGAGMLAGSRRLLHLAHGDGELREAKLQKRQRVEQVEIIKRDLDSRPPARIEPTMSDLKPGERLEKEKQFSLIEPEPMAELPPLSLLDPPRPTGHRYSEEALQALSRLVELKLMDFGVEAEVVAVHPGPVVTLFEVQLAPGVKVSKVSALAKDLARALSKVSVRIVEVIPGKSAIGIEIPNEQRETVFLSEVLRSEVYEQSRSPLTLVLGKDIGGTPIVADLAKMPHALIAGTTGSGKSVAINAMVLSLIFKSKPDTVRLIMIDPKMLELSVYEGIPHLLAPVVTDMKEAANALRWCVGEMERRYRLMANLGVRNIAGYNRKVLDAQRDGSPLRDPFFQPDPMLDEPQESPLLKTMPYVVVIIDELADMMMVVGKKVEELICRLAQKARAAGVHLLLATQRPSVDVITGLIKANIPTRIAFQVSSRVDSRTILDQMGAEQLLGHGDMLFLPPGGNLPMRTHGAYVDDNEVHRVVEWLRKSGSPQYVDEILEEPAEPIPGLSPELAGGDTEGADPLFDEAVRIVTESRRASISGVQRRLKIGYNRAARLIEEMERIGIVTPPESNGNREVLAPPPPAD
jgi:S-DNA-T family DNA segregation ATPase FtsK/SpoIIIE